MKKNFSPTLIPDARDGSIALSLLLLVFVLSLAAAGIVGVVLWRDVRQHGIPADMSNHPFFQLLRVSNTAPSPAAEPERDALQPQFIVDEELGDQTTELETSLLAPLRAYYATKKERLGTVRVTKAPTEAHSAEVTYELQLTDDTNAAHTFFYDREGKERDGKYPLWEPSLLDKTE